MSDDWKTWSAADLGRGIEAGKIDPIELTQSFLDAIDAHPFGERIYARTTPDRALAEATEARNRARAGLRVSPLDGVPISWKDLYDTAGVATESGSRILQGRVPDEDAEVLQNATSAGLICLGKTHQTELAFSGLGYNPVTATPPCVNDHMAVPGGSSSGAATSVAFGLAAAGVGSDTGGSVRIPATWNDLVGLKTTSGLISLKGVVPLAASFDTVGPLCRTVEDCALTLSCFTGAAPADLADATLAGTRLLILENTLDDTRDTPRAGFENACQKMQKAGATLETRSIRAVDTVLDIAGTLMATEAYATWADEIDAGEGIMFAPVRERFLSGKSAAGFEYVQCLQELERQRAAWMEDTSGYDAVILPSSLILPPKIEQLAADHDFFAAENLMALRNTRMANLLGLASLTVPTGVPSTGLMFFGPPMSEHRLLRLGAATEKALA